MCVLMALRIGASIAFKESGTAFGMDGHRMRVRARDAEV